MLKKFSALLAALLLTCSVFVVADEGMWLLSLLKKYNEADMQKAGFKLTADDIYNVNNGSIKDAIASLGGFCTAELISAEGLLITNHHCAFDAIQTHSTVEHDYLTDGFWAMSRDKELSNEGLFAKFLVRMEDVTDKVKSQISDTLSEAQRMQELQKIYGKLSKEATEGTDHTAEVKSFFHGNQFFMFVFITYKDVRLVGAPPGAIGKFGGDTDNWMWPRHTGDFSIFRVYTAPDGKPAEYAKENIPLKPKHFLPVSVAGVKKDDFAMVLGFPGRTDRFLVSAGVKLALDKINPTIVKIRDKKLAIIKEDMNADAAVRIKYAAKYAQSSNYWKYYIGQTKGLVRMRVYDQKKQQEQQFMTWANADASRKAKYGSVLANMEKNYAELDKYALSRYYLVESIFQGPEILGFAYGFDALNTALSAKETSDDEIKALTEELKKEAETHFKDYNLPTDKKLFSALLKMYYENVPKDQHPPVVDQMASKYKGSFDEWADDVLSSSMFATKEKTEAFLNAPSAKKLSKDMAFKTIKGITDFYFASVRTKIRALEQANGKEYRAYVAGLMEMNPEKKFYPDANSTIRVSYGNVKDYYPMDAVYYNFMTYLDGIMEKMDNSNEEFVVPSKIEQLYKAKDYGIYAENGKLPVNFITTNDITGGNSGSPVINGNGELIGLAFDGNWEAMSGDIAFDAEYKRTINVDIRYVLFVIDKYAGASHLIKEMKVVGSPEAKALGTSN